MPDLNHNLLAISKLTEKGFRIEIEKHNMSIISNSCIINCEHSRGLYVLKFEPIIMKTVSFLKKVKTYGIVG